MTKMSFPVGFGKVVYAPGAPKGALRWVWACQCNECSKLDLSARLVGPFKTKREAMADFEAKALALADGWHGVRQ